MSASASASDTPVSLDVHDRIAVITIDSPPVNALGHAVRTGVMAALDKAEADDGIDAVVVNGRPIRRNGRDAGDGSALPGRLLRGGAAG